MFYATTEQKLIHSFWNVLRIRRKINQLHQSSFYASSIYYTTQNNPWICRYRFNGKDFLIFFCITPHTHRIKKSTVEFHTSKNILKMIKQSNQSRQVEKYLYYHKHDESASIFGMMREGRSLKFKFESWPPIIGRIMKVKRANRSMSIIDEISVIHLQKVDTLLMIRI